MYLECGPCTIRSWREGDEETLPLHANNRKVWLNLRDRFPHPYTRSHAEQFIKRLKGVTPETNFAIDVDGEAVGGIGLVLHDGVETVGPGAESVLPAGFYLSAIRSSLRLPAELGQNADEVSGAVPV